MGKVYFVIMGAAVRANGVPSGAMLRRVNAALEMSKKYSNTCFLPSGGVGATGFSEALTMKKLILDAGIPEEKIFAEEESTSTMSSVINSIKILREKNDIERVVVCSDVYHIPRCRWLFRMMGMKTGYAPVASGLKPNGLIKWCYFYFREVFGIPVDTLLILFYRLRNSG